MRDDPSVIRLVERARDGDQHAWNELVERYAPLVWSVCNRYQLNRTDIDDVGQTVWLLLVEQLGNLRASGAPRGSVATTPRAAAGPVCAGGAPPIRPDQLARG